MIYIFTLCTFHLSVDIFFKSAYIWGICIAVDTVFQRFDRVLLLSGKLLNQGFLVPTVALMTWFMVMEYLCHSRSQICYVCGSHNPTPFHLS